MHNRPTSRANPAAMELLVCCKTHSAAIPKSSGGALSVNCLATAGNMIAVIQPGGFELHALAHLPITAQAIRERVNPDLHVLGAVIANAHRRRRITE